MPRTQRLTRSGGFRCQLSGTCSCVAQFLLHSNQLALQPAYRLQQLSFTGFARLLKLQKPRLDILQPPLITVRPVLRHLTGCARRARDEQQTTQYPVTHNASGLVSAHGILTNAANGENSGKR